MARRVTLPIPEHVALQIAGTNNLRPGVCGNAKCATGIARPVGGPTWPVLPCPLCGQRCSQSTWGSRTVRDGQYVLLSQAEAKALAHGESITVEEQWRPPPAASLALELPDMDHEALVDLILAPTTVGFALDQANRELARRLHAAGLDSGVIHTVADSEPVPLDQQERADALAVGRERARADDLRQRLDAQDWRCVYPCEAPGVGGKIRPGEPLALAHDNHGLCHHRCARIGVAPERS